MVNDWQSRAGYSDKPYDPTKPAKGRRYPISFTVAKGEALIEYRKRSLLDDADCCLAVGLTFDQVRGWYKKGIRWNAPPEFAEFALGWAQAKLFRKERLMAVLDESMSEYVPEKMGCQRGNANVAMWMIGRLEQGRVVRHLDHEELAAEIVLEDSGVDALLDDPPEELVEAFRRKLDRLKAIVAELEADARPESA
jgi:hypothetical protein